VRLHECTRPPRLRLAAVVIAAASALATASSASAQQTTPQAPTPATPQQEAEADQGSPHELFVTVGKSIIVNSAATIERIAVGYNDVAEATAIGLHEVLVNGKAPGETTLIIWQRDGNRLFFDLTVRANTSEAKAKLQALRRELKRQLPDENIDVSFENGTVFLSGTVPDVTAAQRAEAIAGTLGKTIDLLYVAVPPSEAEILLNIKFALIDNTVTKQFGFNLINTGAGNSIGGTTTGQYAPPSLTPGSPLSAPPTVTLSNALNVFLLDSHLNLGATIEALEARNLFEILSEPNVLAINGQPATFLAGGKFPYPVVQGGGTGSVPTVTIQFQEFGVRLNFVATLTPRGTIRLELAPEVSALDFSNGLIYQGFNIPGIDVRRVHTEIELEPGQSFAIGGLMDRRTTELLSKIPVLGDIPILGKLFQSRSVQKENTELLVLATPQLVRPIPAGQKGPELKFPQTKSELLPKPITDTPVHTPGPEVTGPVTATPSKPAIPLEDLLQIIKNPGTRLPGETGTSPQSGGMAPPK
jgi:pilus assembly protein CpaC